MTDPKEQVGNWRGWDNPSVTTKLRARDPNEVHAVRLWVKEGDTGHGGDTIGLIFQTGTYVVEDPLNKYYQKIWRTTWGCCGSLGILSTFGEAVEFLWNEHLRETPSEEITHKTIGGVRYEVTKNDLVQFTSFAEHLKKRDPS